MVVISVPAAWGSDLAPQIVIAKINSTDYRIWINLGTELFLRYWDPSGAGTWTSLSATTMTGTGGTTAK